MSGLAWQATPGGYIGALCDGVPEDVALRALGQWAVGRPQPIGGLVIQDLRGGLDAARSGCLRNLSEALDAPIAILTDSPLLRGAAACHWLGERVCAFGARDCERAFETLNVPVEERAALRSALRALKVAHKLTSNRRARRQRAGSSAA
jgi:hypothetical protein